MEPQIQTKSATDPSFRDVRRASELFTEAWGIFTKHWKLFALILGIPTVLSSLSPILTVIAAEGTWLRTFFIVISVVLTVVGVVLSIAAQAGAIDAFQKLHTALPVSVGTQYKLGFKLFFPLIWIAIINILVALGSFVFLIVPVAFFWIFSTLTLFVFVIENKRGFNAFIGSYSLIKNRMWSVFGKLVFLLLVVALAFICSTLLQFFISSIIEGSIIRFQDASLLTIILTTIVNIIIPTIVTIISYGYLFGLYRDLKNISDTSITDEVHYKKWLKVFFIVGIISFIIGIVLFITLILLTPVFLQTLFAPSDYVPVAPNYDILVR